MRFPTGQRVSRALLFAMATTALVAMSAAPAALASTSDTWSARSVAVFASWVWTDQSGCVTTTVQVQGVQLAENPGKEFVRLTAGAVYVSSFDSCLETYLVDGNGYRQDMTASEFAFRPDLGGAVLQTTIPLLDQVTNTLQDVVIDVEWTASGERTVLEQAPYHYVFDGIMSTGHELTFGRIGTATGTITIAGMQFVLGASEPNYLISTTDTSVIVPV